MPTVEKVSGGRVLVRGIGRFEPGDRADVSADDAAYLCDERGDFRRLESYGEPDGSDEADESDDEGDEAATESDASDDTDNDLVRVESYTREGLCGYFDPESMDDPCGRAAGWGRDADDGPCTDHAED